MTANPAERDIHVGAQATEVPGAMRRPAAATARKRQVCFFVKGIELEAFDRIEFYAQDLRALREAGYEVHRATRIRDLRRADVIYVWWWTWALIPVLFGLITRCPVVVTGVLDMNYYVERPWWHQAIIRLSFRLAQMNILVSKMEFDDLPRRFRVRRPQLSLLSVDTDTYCPGGPRVDDLILTVSWIQEANAARKCLAEVIRAAAIVHVTHPRVKFVIAGARGNWTDQALALIAELDATSYVTLAGAITRSEKIALMQRCTLYLQPSRSEGFGLAILEAMSCGAPVITSPVGAVPEVAGDAAIMVNGTRPELIAAAVKDCLDDERRRVALGGVARHRALAFFAHTRRNAEIAAMLDQLPLRTDS